MEALHLNLPSETQIWAWLDNVPDPEIPVISVVDPVSYTHLTLPTIYSV